MRRRVAARSGRRLPALGGGRHTGVAVAQELAPAFEVATIKPSDGPEPLGLQRVGNRIVTTNTPLSWLIKWAYNLDDDRVIGVPRGAEGARFDITGKAPEEVPAPGRLQAMMRTLLADRFGLAVHTEAQGRSRYRAARPKPIQHY